MKTQLFKFACLIICLLTIAPNCHAGSKWKAKHVVLIGLDGWGAYSVEKANIPHIKQLMNDGSYTLTKRSVLPSSSAVNWASMFMEHTRTTRIHNLEFKYSGSSFERIK